MGVLSLSILRERVSLSPRPEARGCPSHGGKRPRNPSLVRTSSRPDGPPFPPLGDMPRGPRPAQLRWADGAAGWIVGAPSRGSGTELYHPSGATGPGPPLGTLTQARCGSVAPCCAPRAPGYPTLPSPSEGGGGFKVSPPAGNPGGTERPGVLSSPFTKPNLSLNLGNLCVV